MNIILCYVVLDIKKVGRSTNRAKKHNSCVHDKKKKTRIQ